ncbi:mitochondrial ribosomal protein L9 [Andrena cerasifolii]|uniref:mitochondrial ribosomal protein L9 n=1 Tax=Andrena cerasifolii TaxID=2819439 RepID=UPI004037E78C
MLRYTNLCVSHLRAQSTMLLSNQMDLLTQQTRNTFILKRRYPAPLYKKNQKPPPMKSKYFIYDLVENTVSRKQKPVDLILLNTVKRVGTKGQKVTVAPFKAYNNLLLPKLAVYATPENMKEYTIDDAEAKKDMNIQSSEFVDKTLSVLSQHYLSVQMSAYTPWTIEKWHLRASFRKEGIIVPEDAMTIPEKAISGPDLSIENKEFYVTVKINNCEEVKVRCKIHHWPSDVSNQAGTQGDIPFWDLPSIAIFPEDQPILDSLPKHRLYTERTDENDE